MFLELPHDVILLILRHLNQETHGHLSHSWGAAKLLYDFVQGPFPLYDQVRITSPLDVKALDSLGVHRLWLAQSLLIDLPTSQWEMRLIDISSQILAKELILKCSIELHPFLWTPNLPLVSHHLRYLTLLGFTINVEILWQWSRSLEPVFPFLEELVLTRAGLNLHAANAIASCANSFPLLKILDLSHNRLGSQGFLALTDCSDANVWSPAKLVSLKLAGNGIRGSEVLGEDNRRSIYERALIPQWQHLDLCGNFLGRDFVHWLIRRSQMPLTRLQVSHCDLDSSDVLLLASYWKCVELDYSRNAVDRLIGEWVVSLESLNLDSVILRNRHLKQLCDWATSLRHLEMSHCELDNFSCFALATLKNIETLIIEFNQFDATGVRALLESPHLKRLSVLGLSGNHLERLTFETELPLMELSMNACRLGVRGTLSLAEAKFTRNLQKLLMSGNQMGAQGCKSLLVQLIDIQHLDLSYNNIGNSGGNCFLQVKLPHLVDLRLAGNHLSHRLIHDIHLHHSHISYCDVGFWAS